MARKQGAYADITGPKVRATALRLIAQHGYAAVSMRQIAAEVGVQVGALYNYTADKQTLLFDLMDGHMVALLAAARALPTRATPLERLEDFTRFHIQFHLPRTDAVFVAYMELRNLTPENFGKVETLRREYEGILEDILAVGEASGDFEITDTRVTTMALIGLLTGLHDWYRRDGRLGTDEIMTMYWGLVRKAVTA